MLLYANNTDTSETWYFNTTEKKMIHEILSYFSVIVQTSSFSVKSWLILIK